MPYNVGEKKEFVTKIGTRSIKSSWKYSSPITFMVVKPTFWLHQAKSILFFSQKKKKKKNPRDRNLSYLHILCQPTHTDKLSCEDSMTLVDGVGIGEAEVAHPSSSAATSLQPISVKEATPLFC